MNFTITKILQLDNKTVLYYIKCEKLIMDHSIANRLNLYLNEYQDILKQFGAVCDGEDYQFYFSSEEDCQKAIEYLESYLIIKKLGS